MNCTWYVADKNSNMLLKHTHYPLSRSFVYLFFLLCVVRLNFAIAQQKPVNTDSLRKVAFSDKADTIRVDAFLALSRSLVYSNPDTTLYYLNIAKEILKPEEDPKRYNGILSGQTIAFNSLGDYQKSLKVSDLSLKISKQYNYSFGEAAAHIQKGTTLFFIARYENAIEDFFKAYNIAKVIDNDLLQIKAINNVAACYLKLKKFDQAEEIYKRGLDLAVKNNITEEIGALYLNIGTTSIERGNYELSLKYLDSADLKFDLLKNQYAKGLIFANKAFANKQLRNYDLAIDLNLKSLTIRDEIGDRAGITRIYNNMGTIYLEQANWEKALEYTQLALGMAKEINRSEDIKIAYQNLALIYERQKRYKEALDYNKQLTALTDSLQNVTNAKEAEWAKILVESENDVSNTELMSEFEENKRTYYIFYIAIIVLCLGLSVLSLRQYQSNTKTQKKLQLFRKKNVMLEQEVEGLKEKSDELKNKYIREKQLNGTQHRVIKEIHDIFKDKTNDVNTNWSKFHLLFSSIYPDFMESLKQHHPDLTTNDTRLAALIKINLSQSNMAELLNITPESVRKARYRMSKKMGMQSDQDMVDYIIKL